MRLRKEKQLPTPITDESESEEITETEGFSSDNNARAPVSVGKGKPSVQNSSSESARMPQSVLPVLEADQPMSTRMQTFWIRGLSTLAMLGVFAVVMMMGHFYCAFTVLVLTVGMFREILRINSRVEKDRRLPLFYFLRWYIFCGFFGLGFLRWLSTSFEWESLASSSSDTPMNQIAWAVIHIIRPYFAMVVYSACVFGVIIFTLSLRKSSLRYQFQQLGWISMTCLFVVLQAIAQIANIYMGLFWFFLPTTLVISNDIFAYIFGVFFGKTRLIALSPKKTWEGFIGAAFCTIAWGFLFCYLFAGYSQISCPEPEFHMRPFEYMTNLSCPTRDYLRPFVWSPPAFLTGGSTHIHYTVQPIYIHAFVLAFFAAFIAPFGGFFASGFKRAFRIKDFDNAIPGHGGLTDRFDCQILMGTFTFVYLHTFVYTRFISSGEVPNPSLSYNNVASIATLLPAADKARLVELIKNQLNYLTN